jgi:hypothetical protein
MVEQLEMDGMVLVCSPQQSDYSHARAATYHFRQILSDHFFRSYPYFILDQIEKLARHSA